MAQGSLLPGAQRAECMLVLEGPGCIGDEAVLLSVRAASLMSNADS